MKRDMDLVRQIMLDVEAGKTFFDSAATDENGLLVEDESVNLKNDLLLYHIQIMQGASLLSIQAVTDGGILLGGLTWEGHDFLDTVRDPEVWKRTKDGANKMGGWTFGLLKDLGAAYLKHVAKERLGLDL